MQLRSIRRGVWTALPRLRRAGTAKALGGADLRVRVRGGYEPDTVVARAGRPLRLTFRREESAACSERVIFPAFGKSAMLPPYEDVAIDLPPLEPGEYEFTCQFGVLRGRLLVRGGGAGSESAA